jgi:hypothetical protein
VHEDHPVEFAAHARSFLDETHRQETHSAGSSSRTGYEPSDPLARLA